MINVPGVDGLSVKQWQDDVSKGVNIRWAC